MQNLTNHQTFKVRLPQYMKEFKCTGSECEDVCCRSWKVIIDKKTYNKYKKISKAEIKEKLDKNIKRLESGSNDTKYAKIKNDSTTGFCPFLSTNRLCILQQRFGEEYLCDTCAVYPRAINKVGDVLEESGEMSCPEVAKRALLNPEGIKFEEKEIEFKRAKILNKVLELQYPDSKQKLKKYFWQIRKFTFELVQRRSLRLADRLIILGIFYEKIQKIMEGKRIDKIPDTIAGFQDMLKNETLKKSLAQLPNNIALQMVLLKQLIDKRIANGISSQRYADCYAEFLKGVNFDKASNVVEIAAKYKLAYRRYFEPFIKDNEYIMENYIVNYIFKHVTPYANTDYENIFSDYTMLVVSYSAVKMQLIGMAGFHKGINENLVIKLIQSFGKTMEHNDNYRKDALNILQKNGCTTMAHMAILIKN
ncbi:MAG: lysine-N-methylase [Gammaproteobacteria bacterium]|nr:lysine-N-methylase [Gammaproteobacteria bacterium]HJP19417.1 flagellin lysine-N-methylase [Nitrospinota bacterium]